MKTLFRVKHIIIEQEDMPAAYLLDDSREVSYTHKGWMEVHTGQPMTTIVDRRGFLLGFTEA